MNELGEGGGGSAFPCLLCLQGMMHAVRDKKTGGTKGLGMKGGGGGGGGGGGISGTYMYIHVHM